jgi:PAS domain S-box-containing protein
VKPSAPDASYQWRLQLLVTVSKVLAESLDYEQPLREMARLALPSLADWCTISVILPDGTLQRLVVEHRDESLREAAREYERSYPPSGHRTQKLLSVLRSGEALVASPVPDESLAASAQDERHLQLLRTLGCRSCLLAPMVVRGQVVGVISFIRADDSRAFDDEDVTLAEELGRRAAAAVDNAHLHRAAVSQEKEKRRQAERRLELLVANISDYAVFMLDEEGKIATWNSGAQRIKGWTADEIIGRHFSIFYPPDDVKAGKCERVLEQAARTGRYEEEGWRLRKGGNRFWANVVINAIRDADGRLAGFSKVTRDLTERCAAAEQQSARQAAENANRAKDEFLAMLGHELRNPLTPIVTALQIMKLRADTKSSREQQVIERQVHHMQRLVDDLLDVSRITRGKIEIKRQLVDLRDVVATAIEIASPLLEQRHHHLDVDVPSERLCVEGDDARLAQVFANLITNAAKYTQPGGHITVHVQKTPPQALVEVVDDGAGIASELMPRLFDLFVQGAQGSDRAGGGLGIGLSLVRSLVELHGGTVHAESEGLGRGSTFAVQLPLAARVELPAQTNESEPLAPAACARRILLVDDNLDALDLLAELLRSLGHEVRTAPDGPSALTMAREFGPDLAVVDIGLPVMDGYELATRLREDLGESTPRLIALTGYGQYGDRARSSEAGFDTHLVKPVDMNKLVETLQSVRARRN